MFHRGVGSSVRLMNRGFGAVLGFSLLLSSFLEAASIEDRNVESLSDSSKNVYRVEIVSQNSIDHKGFPLTKLTAKILETFKGYEPNTETVNFFLPGGQSPLKKSRRVYLSGTPHFKTGGEYIIFLSKVPSALEMNRLEAWEAFAVSKDESSGERYVVRMREAQDIQSFRKSHSKHSHQMHSLSADGHSMRIRPYEEVVSEIFSAN